MKNSITINTKLFLLASEMMKNVGRFLLEKGGYKIYLLNFLLFSRRGGGGCVEGVENTLDRCKHFLYHTLSFLSLVFIYVFI